MKILKTGQTANTATCAMALLGVWWLCACVSGLTAQVTLPVTYLPLEGKKAGVEPNVLIFKDKEQQRSAKHAWGDLQHGHFQPYATFEKPGMLEFGQEQHWIAFVLENKSADSVDLVIMCTWADTLWVKRKGGLTQSIIFPRSFPEPDPLGLLPYDLRDGTTFQIYPGGRDTLLLTGRLTKQHNLLPRLSHVEDYENYRLQSVAHINYLLCWCMGATLSVLLFAFAQYFQHRDSAFLWYGFYLLALIFNGWQSFEDKNPDFYFSYYVLSPFWTKMFQMAIYFAGIHVFCLLFFETRTGKTGPFNTMYLRLVLVSCSCLSCATELILLGMGLLYQDFCIFYRTSLTTLAFFFWRSGVPLAKRPGVGPRYFHRYFVACLGSLRVLVFLKPWALHL